MRKKLVGGATAGLMAVATLRGMVHSDHDTVATEISGDCGNNRLTRQIEDLKRLNHYQGVRFIVECTLGGSVDNVTAIDGDGTNPNCQQSFEMIYSAEDDVFYSVSNISERRLSLWYILPIISQNIDAADC